MRAFAADAVRAFHFLMRRAERRFLRTPPPRGFFDEHPRFMATSGTVQAVNRLNQRYAACIAANEKIIRGKRILDLTSHDGRFSFAALALGASHVLGIEARERLVADSVAAMREYGAKEDSYRFILGDVFAELDRIPPGSVDTVFCFGFFYHTIRHVTLLAKIARLQPAHVIIDTDISLSRDPIVRLRAERVELERDAVAVPGMKMVLSGLPSRGALELELTSLGWQWRYFNWHSAGIRCWDDIVDYHEGRRVTLVASPAPL